VTAPSQKMFLVPITLTTDMYELFLVLAHSSKIVIFVTNGTYGPPQLLLCLSSGCVLFKNTVSNSEDNIKLYKWMASISEFEGLGRRQWWPII